jgi:hypothetical protein
MTTLYATEGSSLYTVNVTTGATTLIGAFSDSSTGSPLTQIEAIGIDPTDTNAKMYVSRGSTLYSSSSTQYNSLTQIGSMNGDISGLAFAHSNMYGDDNSSAQLVIIDRSTGVATLASGFDVNATLTQGAIGQDPSDQLYALYSATGSFTLFSLVILNSNGSVYQTISATPLDTTGITYYQFSYGLGAMYGLRFNNPKTQIFQISLSTGTIDGNTLVVPKYNGTQINLVAMTFSPSACIHGSSNIQIANELTKPIANIRDNEIIMGADGNPTIALQNIPCWTQIPRTPEAHEAIIFEKDSLGPNLPNQRFAVDPGHPICTPQEFKISGQNALKKARDYLDPTNLNIRLTKWDQIASLFSGQNLRYDLVLPETSCGAYLANGLVVKARISLKDPGYIHN